jgi:hypothetical protein
MPLDPRAHLYYRVANAPLLAYPFPHFYLESVFPDDFYRQMQDALPPLARYVPLAETGTVSAGAYPERFSLDPREFGRAEPHSPSAMLWQNIVQWLEDGQFARLLLDKFESAMASRFGPGNDFSVLQDTRLIRDFTNYAIGPHTDAPRKLVSLLFYLPNDDSMAHLGTSIFEPLEAGFECDGTRHYGFEPFRKVFTAPFKPNSLFAFCKTGNAFHGVEPIADAKIERNLLLYNIYLNKITQTAQPDRGIRWPWSRK